MMHTLYAPAPHKLCPSLDQQAGEVTDLLRRQTTDFGRPFGIFRLLVTLPKQIGQKLFKTHGVIVNECRVIQFFFIQGMRQRQH